MAKISLWESESLTSIPGGDFDVCVCVCVFVYVCICVCVCEGVYVCMRVSCENIYVNVYIHTSCERVCVGAYHVMCTRMFSCIHISIYGHHI